MSSTASKMSAIYSYIILSVIKLIIKVFNDIIVNQHLLKFHYFQKHLKIHNKNKI